MTRWGRVKGRPSLMLTRGNKARSSWMIRLGETFRGEMASQANHAGVVRRDRIHAIESTVPRTREINIEEVYDNPENWALLIECVGLTEAEHEQIEAEAERYLGKSYGWASIAKQSIDGVLGWILGRDVYLTRRLRLPWVKAEMFYNICSWLACWAHMAGRWRIFGLVTHYEKTHGGRRVKAVQRLEKLPCRRVSPDCIWDDVFQHRPGRYIVRAEIGERPPEIPWIFVKKIEADLARAR